MESEFEIHGHGSNYCIILVSTLKLLALLFSPVICIFKKHSCLTCHHYCGFSVLHFQYWLAKKISGNMNNSSDNRQFCGIYSFLSWGHKGTQATIHLLRVFKVHHNAANNTSSSKIQNTSEILLKPERHCKMDEHVVKGDEYKTKLMNCYIVSFI